MVLRDTVARLSPMPLDTGGPPLSARWEMLDDLCRQNLDAQGRRENGTRKGSMVRSTKNTHPPKVCSDHTAAGVAPSRKFASLSAKKIQAAVLEWRRFAIMIPSTAVDSSNTRRMTWDCGS